MTDSWLSLSDRMVCRGCRLPVEWRGKWRHVTESPSSHEPRDATYPRYYEGYETTKAQYRVVGV